MAREFNLGEPIYEFVEKLNELSEEAANNINPNEISAGVTSTNTLSAGASATATASWDATNKKMNFSFGIPRGNTGANGLNGYTPIKGVDYFTEADKVEIIQAVLHSFTDVSEVAL